MASNKQVTTRIWSRKLFKFLQLPSRSIMSLGQQILREAGGAPPTRVVYHTWLNLGATSSWLTLGPATVVARQYSRQEVALYYSLLVQLADPRGDWLVLDVKLVDFHLVLHKTVLPTEFDLPLPSVSVQDGDHYIKETYNYVCDAYNCQNPLHHLALIAAISAASLLPDIFPPKRLMSHPCPAHLLTLFGTWIGSHRHTVVLLWATFLSRWLHISLFPCMTRTPLSWSVQTRKLGSANMVDYFVYLITFLIVSPASKANSTKIKIVSTA